MTLDLEGLKGYLRIDHSEDDQILHDLWKRARINVKNQAGPIDEQNADMVEQFNQACALLVQHWYDNREAFRIGNASYEIPHSLDSILRQLRYCYPAGDTS